MSTFLKVAAFAIGTSMAGAVAAAPLAVTDSYEGDYTIENAFDSHGLWLPGFLGDNTWSVESGNANHTGDNLSMSGRVKNTVDGTDYFLDFDFSVTKTSDHPNGLVCGTIACNAATQEMRDNIVFFDMGIESIMGTVTGVAGTLLEGLEMIITMRPLEGEDRKPGQLGFGGNWVNLDFGYSNWMRWDVIANNSNVRTGSGNHGDVNFDFIPDDGPGEGVVPLPAGLPLILTGAAALFGLRRRKNA